MSFEMITPYVAAEGYSDLIWEWNGVDVSQFDSATTWKDNDQRITPTVVSSTVAHCSGDNVLRFTFTRPGGSSGVSGAAVLFIDGDMPFDDDDRSCRIEYGIAATNAPTPYFGFSFFGDDDGSSVSAYSVLPIGGATWLCMTEDNARIYNGSTINGTTLVSNGRDGGVIQIFGGKTIGDIPRFSMWMNTTENATSTRVTALHANSWNGTPGASWNPLACKRIGVASQTYGTTVSGSIDLSYLRIYKARTRFG